jgi:bacteriorhodopsin
MEEIIFYIGIVTFSITTVIFLMLKKRNPEVASFNMIVNFTTIASYILMVSGLWTISAVSGDTIYWTRWAFYAVSCSFLMVEIALILRIDNRTRLDMIVFNSMVMLTGLLASISDGIIKWLFFTLSSLAYLYVLALIAKNRSEEKFIFPFVLIFWSGFPVVWIISPAGLMILDAFWTAIFYFILDLITKVYFGIHSTLKYSKK